MPKEKLVTNTPIEKKKRLVMIRTGRFDEMVDEIKKKRGYQYTPQVVSEAVALLHAKMFPAYTMPTAKIKDPEEAEIARKELHEHEQKVQEENYIGICQELGGKIDGTHCIYYKYGGKFRYEQKVPLKMLTPDLVRAQYSPSKEKVEALHKEGKTKWE